MLPFIVVPSVLLFFRRVAIFIEEFHLLLVLFLLVDVVAALRAVAFGVLAGFFILKVVHGVEG